MRFFLLFALLAVLLAAPIDAGWTHKGATGVVKQRMDAMSDVGRRMKAVAQMIKGRTDYDAAKVRTDATAIATHADGIAELFPEGSDKSPSEASPEIWRDWPRFVELANALKIEAKGLADAAAPESSVTDIAPQFKALGRQCADCHKSFRVKKEH